MDIVGPLPHSRRGNQYRLVVCDYATRYPEAIPLRSIEAGTVTEHLMQLFYRVGIPREILSDQGTNFVTVTKGALQFVECQPDSYFFISSANGRVS